MDNRIFKDIIRTVESKNLVTDSLADVSDQNILDSMYDRKKKNLLVIYDEQGHEIARCNNKVVASGRVETLETLFRVYNISDKFPDISYERPDNQKNPRWISVFGLGSGGASPSEGHNPYIVNPNATELTTPIQFRTQDAANSKIKYYDNFKKKDFSSVYLNWDQNTDDIFAVLTCELAYDDLLGKIINEVGLYNCLHSFDELGNVNGKSNFTLYAKANMPSINKSPLENTSSFKIAYKVFM